MSADMVNNDPITIGIKDVSCNDTMFCKIKRSTKMVKVFKAYAARKGVTAQMNSHSLRFIIDGDHINPSDTPNILDLEGR